MPNKPSSVDFDAPCKSRNRNLVRRTFVAGPWAAAAILSITVPVGAAADDQARLDAAMEEFNERMTAAGWVSEGLPDEATGSSDPTEGDLEAEVVSADDEQFAECLGELAAIFGSADADEFPGQTALSFSEEFTFAPDSDGTATTDFMSFDIREETAAAFGASVDDANVSTLTTFVEAFGAKDTGDCLREALEADIADDADDSEIPMEFEFDVANEPDLGVGDHSSRLSFTISINLFGAPIEFDAGFYVAQAGRDVVGVIYSSAGDATSEFDPITELQALVDSLNA